MKIKINFRQALTLVEILVASLVLSIFLAGAYSLFYGGQKIANKATWLQTITNDLRKAEQIITNAIKTTSYPSTLLPTAIIDAGGTNESPAQNSQNFYVRILCGIGEKTANQLIALDNGIFLVMPKCSPEKQGYSPTENRPGVLTWMILRAIPDPAGTNLAQIVYEERTTTYSTTPPNYVNEFNSNYNELQVSFRSILCQNIQSIRIEATAGHKPSQITITIRATYPKDTKLFRESTSAAIPNVGIYTPPTS